MSRVRTTHQLSRNARGDPTLTDMVIAHRDPSTTTGEEIMKSLLTTATLAIGLALPAVAQVDPGRSSPLAAGVGKQTQAQTEDCTGMWNRADVNHKGVLDGKELDKFRSVLNRVDTNKDGKISQSEFMTACQKGELKNVQL